jgi:ABC-type Fe3+-siderophore transport system permease subunit
MNVYTQTPNRERVSVLATLGAMMSLVIELLSPILAVALAFFAVALVSSITQAETTAEALRMAGLAIASLAGAVFYWRLYEKRMK